MIRGLTPKGYHADNGRYAESTVKQDCVIKGQSLTFYGVGACHQNGVAESKIKQLTLARVHYNHAVIVCITYWRWQRTESIACILTSMANTRNEVFKGNRLNYQAEALLYL